MKRCLAVAVLFLGCAAFAFPVLCQTTEKTPPVEGKRSATMREKNQAILNSLHRVVETKPLEDGVKLNTALEFISRQFDGKLPIVVDKQAFYSEMGFDAPNPDDQQILLPTATGKMTASMALRLIVAQVGKANGAFLVRQGFVEITTVKQSTAAFILDQPTVAASFDNRPLSEVLQTLTDETGLEIHLDPNLAKKGNLPITATFRNSSLENALVIVTEMAELKFVVLERSVYVTTAANAKLLEAEETQRSIAREKSRKSLGIRQPQPAQ